MATTPSTAAKTTQNNKPAAQPAPAPAPQPAVEPQAPAGPLTNLTLEQVQRILTSRKIIDQTFVGQVIDKGLRIVGKGNATKNTENPRVVYNTNAMRRSAMAEAAGHVRAALASAAIGDDYAVQEAFRQALNVGVLSFSMPADWEQFPANAMITAMVDEFTISSGPDAGKKGIGLGTIRLMPGVTAKAEADTWADLFGEADDTSVPNAANVIA